MMNSTEKNEAGTPILSTEPEVFKPINEMTRPEIVAEIGRIESELPNDEALYRQWETIYKKNAGGSTRSAFFIAGVAIGIFFNIIVGAIIVSIGASRAGNSRARNEAAQQMQLGQRQITFKRGRLAELKTLFEKQAPASADKRLAELIDLKTKGLITEAEYNIKRQQILNEI